MPLNKEYMLEIQFHVYDNQTRSTMALVAHLQSSVKRPIDCHGD
jgi:hypothetical protein